MRNNALSIANEIIDLANQDHEELDLLKLIKLTYIAHGMGLAFLDGESIIDPRFDKVEAWRLGPVIPSVYHSFKYKRNNKITTDDKAVVFEADSKIEIPVLQGDIEKKIIKFVWDRFKYFSSCQLVDLLHLKGTPWDLCYIPDKNAEIPDSLTQEYYTNILEELEKSHKNQ